MLTRSPLGCAAGALGQRILSGAAGLKGKQPRDAARQAGAQRDNAWTRLCIDAKVGPLTHTVTEWGPNTVTLNLTSDKALACRKLARNIGTGSLNGKIDNLCHWTTATFTVHVDVKKPATPLP